MSINSFRSFVLVTLIVSLWVHASETFRYFVFVIPAMQGYFADFEGVAQMNISIFAIWGLWDTLLTGLVVFMYWLFAQQFGETMRSALASATISWLFFFVLFWAGLWNMGMSPARVLLIALPLSLLEMIVASVFARYLYKKIGFTQVATS